MFYPVEVLLREKLGGNIFSETKCYLVHPDDSEEELVSDADGYVVGRTEIETTAQPKNPEDDL